MKLNSSPGHASRGIVERVADTLTSGPPLPETLIPSQRARRERIITAALRLLEHGEYDKIQMRDIAEEADVALGTVYRYFTSKEHLFAAVLVVWSDSLRGRVQRRPLAGATPAERLKDLMGRVLNAFDRYPQFLRLITVLENTPDPYARDFHGQFSSHTETTFLQPLDSLDPEDARAVIDVVKAVLWSLLRRWSHGQMTMREARRRMARSIDLIFSPPPPVKARRHS
jgi:TetR/AcrR family transcriptional regulator, cholesterol catabolism regulator